MVGIEALKQRFGKVVAEDPTNEMGLVFEVVVKRFAVFTRCGNDVGNLDSFNGELLGEAHERFAHKLHGVGRCHNAPYITSDLGQFCECVVKTSMCMGTAPCIKLSIF